ncbi:MAG: GAF domain-containing sensor histidine kinase [Chloroflexi bacterium]|nr:GAF domain-containing sensor histidine kinase [Chloroflexota bacterium]
MANQTPSIEDRQTRATRSLNRLVEVSLILNSSLSTEEILTQLMDATAEILNAESASVILMNRNTNELHFVAMPTGAAQADALVRIPVPLEGSIAGNIIKENQAILLNDVSQDPRHYRNTDDESGFKTRSLLGVPMRIKDRVIGALEAVNKIGDHWEPDDQNYLEILAAQAAIALEKAELVDQLQKANAELSQLDKLKNDFIAIASHELRTPLGVILGYASFLKEEAQGELGDHADAVLNSALKMRNLIEDMTNLRFLKIGDSELQRDEVSLGSLLQLVRGDVLAMASANDQTLILQPPDPDVVVYADRALVLMALTNIVNNAVKFTPQDGHIQIKVIDRPQEVWVCVMDDGVGIPERDLENIFKPFYQVEDHMTRRHGGMGLGLSIARAVLEAHRGRVWAESAGQNQGATLTISLPKGWV